MQTLNSTQVAATIAPVIGRLGAEYMLDPATRDAGTAANYPHGFAFYFAGRGGVLGDVDSDVINAAFMFFNTKVVSKMWDLGVKVEGARAAGRRYMKCCDAWGQKNFEGIKDLDKFNVLAEKLVAGVDGAGLSLFAGLRAEPLPDDPSERAYRLITLIRELRGSIHVAATVANGLSGLQAVLAGSGPDDAKFHGWTEPFDDCSHLKPQRERAEEMTSALMAKWIGETLSVEEMNELAVQTVRINEEFRAK